MAEHGGVQGGYLDTLLVPVLSGLDADQLWLCEYDVDFAGRWDELFAPVRRPRRGPADHDPDVSPPAAEVAVVAHRGVPARRTPERVGALPQPAAAAHPPCPRRVCRVRWPTQRWQGHYEFILPTVAKRAGLRVEDLGGEGSFVPPGRERTVYVGKSPHGRPPDLTFGFRPVRGTTTSTRSPRRSPSRGCSTTRSSPASRPGRARPGTCRMERRSA